MNSQHVALLKRGIASWNVWREQTDEQIDLHGADLEGMDLRGANLATRNYNDEEPFDVDLREANLRRCDLREADLSGAHLERADLQNANFMGVHWARAVFCEANLSRALGAKAHLYGVYLKKAKLRQASLYGTLFYWDCDLREADLSGACLRLAYLGMCDGGTKNLMRVNLAEADLSCVIMNSADLREARLSGANISDADLSAGDLSGADLRDANLCETCLARSCLHYADLSGADLSGADLSEVDLREAQFNWFFLLEASTRGVDLRCIQFDRDRVFGGSGYLESGLKTDKALERDSQHAGSPQQPTLPLFEPPLEPYQRPLTVPFCTHCSAAAISDNSHARERHQWDAEEFAEHQKHAASPACRDIRLLS